MELLLRMEGEALTKLRPEQFVAYIGTTVRRHKDALEEVERRRLQREEEARLRCVNFRRFPIELCDEVVMFYSLPFGTFLQKTSPSHSFSFAI